MDVSECGEDGEGGEDSESGKDGRQASPKNMPTVKYVQKVVGAVRHFDEHRGLVRWAQVGTEGVDE